MEKANNEKCGEALDRRGQHLLKCGNGRGRFGVHKALELGMRECLKERGLYADLERAVPELYKWEEGGIKEAILDVVVRAPCNPRNRWIDVTVRCPHRGGKDNSGQV